MARVRISLAATSVIALAAAVGCGGKSATLPGTGGNADAGTSGTGGVTAGAGGTTGGAGAPATGGGGGSASGGRGGTTGGAGASGKANCTAKAVSAGQNHTCAVTVAGGLRCWGINDRGELGYGNTTDGLYRPFPNEVLTGVKEVGAGYRHTCALLESGGVRCWGDNQYTQLGMPTSVTGLLAPPPTDLLTGARAISVGDDHACAILATDGAVRCWGRGGNVGVLGDNMLTGVQSISAGASHTCAVTATGGVRCWGLNSKGQLGDGTTTDRGSTDTPDVLTGVKAVAAGNQFTCALTTEGGVRCWGENYGGQLGDGTLTSRSTPTPNDVLTGVAAISAGYGHTCALMVTGGVRCWGDNQSLALGVPDTTSVLTPPTTDVLTGVRAMDSGGAFNCVITTTNTVRCWGQNAWGQLGDNRVTRSHLPTAELVNLDGRCP